MSRLPEPAASRALGHLPRWTFDPIGLLEEGARLGPVFRIRLWRPVIVGYRPEWTRTVLGDLDTFRSRGSLSTLTPYLAAGVVQADEPEHTGRRHDLNPHFHRRAITAYTARLHAALAPITPRGPFDALAWSALATRRMLGEVFFAGAVPDDRLAAFLHPLQRPAPAPLLPRPVRFARLNTAIRRVLNHPPPHTIAAALAGRPHAVEDLRVGLAAGYDTTAHTLAWALWHLADRPEWQRTEMLPAVIDETLRLYPAGWIGSRVCHHHTVVAETAVPAGTMVMYSPFLTHRDPALWEHPGEFRPDRFAAGRPAWGFIPFAAGRRTCLGAQLARAMLATAITGLMEQGLTRIGGDPRIRTSISLRPHGPLLLNARSTARAGPDGSSRGGQLAESRPTVNASW